MSTNMEKATEANRLYWNSETSVGDIAQRLELSRRALYDALQPMPAGATCASCGGELVFENRSARSAHQAVCAACGAAAGTGAEPETAPEPRPVPMPAVDANLIRLGGALLAGAVAGAIVTLIAIPRR